LAHKPIIYDVRAGPQPQAIAAAVAALAAGGLVAMPTETVYGLAADAGNPRAVAAIFLAKGRPRFNPLITHVSSVEAAGEIAVVDATAARLGSAFWPGPLTLVLARRGQAVSDIATAGLDTVAVRVPAHPVAEALLAAFGRPLVAPSANRSGHVSATEAAHVIADLGEAVSIVLDAGRTRIGLESTIVDLTGESPRLLRAGAVARAEVEQVLGRRLLTADSGVERPQAPGMLASHYAPAARLRLDVHEVAPGEALLAFGRNLPANAAASVATINLSPGGDLAEAAARFFSALRELDRRAPVIAVAPIPDTGLGEAINDRLRRAAAPR
jgi:L-threonylcarbamoyladenylate synthase